MAILAVVAFYLLGGRPDWMRWLSVVAGVVLAATFLVGGRYDVSPAFSLGLRVPWTTATVRQGDGSSVASQALGAPELMGEYRVTLSPRTTLPLDFGLASG